MPFLTTLARWLLRPRPKTLGARGELAAAGFLRRKGYRILAANWHCRGGEVDLIAMQGQTLVFIEVKTRQGERVLPEEQVHALKESRVRHAAEVYLTRYRSNPPAVRFDVVAVIWPAETSKPVFRHDEGAF